MYLNIMNNKKTGKTKLSIRRGYRDENGKVKNTTIKNLGDLEDLKNNLMTLSLISNLLLRKWQKRRLSTTTILKKYGHVQKRLEKKFPRHSLA